VGTFDLVFKQRWKMQTQTEMELDIHYVDVFLNDPEKWRQKYKKEP
jgi:hypothetical protein